MVREEFLLKMRDVLQTDADLSLEVPLESLPEWDSLSVMATMAFLEDDFGVKTSMSDYRSMKTIADIALKAGIK